MTNKTNAKTKSAFSEIYENSDFLKGHQKNQRRAATYEPALESKNQKGSVFYNAHSYPTKIPVDSIVRQILRHTKPGQTVLDPFCGSGMTGLAAKLTGRNAHLSDLGTLALHLASNHVAQCDLRLLRNTAENILVKLQSTSPYFIKKDKREVEVNYVLFADIVRCPKCKRNNSTWEFAKRTKSFSVPAKLACLSCSNLFSRSGAVVVDKVPVQISTLEPGQRSTTSEPGRKLNRIRIPSTQSSYTSEIAKIPFHSNREMHIRSALHLQGVSFLRDFYSDVNWFALSSLFEEIDQVANTRIKAALMLAFTNTAWHGSKMRRFNSAGGHRPLTGTLYFPQLYSEANCFRVFENKIEALVRYYSELEKYSSDAQITLNRNSATNLIRVDDNSVDYIYTDPPFGSNIFYADCNFLAEAWLGSPTDTKLEAVVNKSLKVAAGGKSLETYANLMRDSFSEMNRVMKPNAKISLVFNSSSGEVWQALTDGLSDAGLEVADATLLDKIQLSVKGYKSQNAKENVATTDLVLEIKKRKRRSASRANRTFGAGILKKAYSEFCTVDESDPKYHTANFYSYLLQFCHLNGYSFDEISMSKVADFVRSSAEDAAI